MVVFAKRILMAMIRFHQEGKYMKLVVFNVGSALCVYAEHQTCLLYTSDAADD